MTSLSIDNEIVAHNVNELAKMCHKQALPWWKGEDGTKQYRNKGELLALIHSEISECLEGVRKDCMDDHLPHRKMEEVEMADALIRIFDYCGAYNLDVGNAMMEKMAYNEQRADHRPENRAKQGGKKF